MKIQGCENYDPLGLGWGHIRGSEYECIGNQTWHKASLKRNLWK